MQFLKNSQNKISPTENNLNQLLINCLKTKESGSIAFALIIIIFVIGILIAVALPNLLNQVAKDREPEGKNVVGTMNRVQQSYHFEHKKFSSNLKELGFTSIPESKYYNFSKMVTDKAAYAFAIPKDAKNGQRIYTGAISYLPKGEQYFQIICIGNVAGIEINPNKPILKNGEFICPENMISVK